MKHEDLEEFYVWIHENFAPETWQHERLMVRSLSPHKARRFLSSLCGFLVHKNTNKHTITYTKILKDSILIKHEDIFIKVFKTLF